MLLSWQKLSGLAWWSRASVLQGLKAITQPLCWTAQKAVNVGTFVDIKSPAAQVKWSVNSANKLNTVSEIRCCKMFNNLLFSVIKDPSRGLPGLNTGRRFPWRQRYKRGARMKPPCPRCVWSRSTPNTPNSSTTCGWWSESQLCSFASSGSRATCVWAPQPSEPSSGTNSLFIWSLFAFAVASTGIFAYCDVFFFQCSKLQIVSISLWHLSTGPSARCHRVLFRMSRDIMTSSSAYNMTRWNTKASVFCCKMNERSSYYGLYF